MLDYALLLKSRKRGHDAMYVSASHNGRVHGVTYWVKGAALTVVYVRLSNADFEQTRP